MLFPSMDFDHDHKDNNLIPLEDNPYKLQTNDLQDLCSLSNHLQPESIKNDLADVEGSLWNTGLDLLHPFNPFVGKLPYYPVNVHGEMFMDENHLIEPSFHQSVDPYNLMDKGFEIISSSNIDVSHKTKKNGSKKKRVVDIKSDIIKGQWTPEEDGLLVELVEKYGVGKWTSIAQMLTGRIGKQCRDRWHNHLKPNIKKDRWSEGEDQILIEAHMKLGNKWSEISRFLPGRSENTIKNHWNATKRRQLSSLRKNSRNSKSNDTPLQNYIRSFIKPGGVGGCLENSSSFGSAGYSFNNNQVKWLNGSEMNDEIGNKESWGMLSFNGNEMTDEILDEESWSILSGCSFMDPQIDLQMEMF